MDVDPIVVGELDPKARHRILVVAPHADDEAFGCAGMLAQQARRGSAIEVLVMATGGLQSRHTGQTPDVTQRLGELEKCAQVLGVQKYRVLFPGKDMRLDTLPMLTVVGMLDRTFDETAYDEIFFPTPSHNHDHRVTHDACQSALRPGAHATTPALIAMYEYTYSGWAPLTWPGARLYVDITDTMEIKRQALKAYASQLKPPPNPLSLEAVETMAAMRGVECGCQYAELYYIVQMIRR